MRAETIMELLQATVLCGELPTDEIQSACGSDMMSDVLAFSQEGTLLLTGLLNPQVLRTADMLDIRCVVFVRGKQPNADMIHLAEEYDVAILSTKHTLFTAAGKLYERGLRGH